MKCTVVIDPQREEEIVVYAHERNELIDSIEKLAADEVKGWAGYRDHCVVPFALEDVVCFTVRENKVFVVTETERLQLKQRLYQLESRLPPHFIKIHQSCIANLKQVRRFDASLSGALRVIFKNGYSDYVSRRQVKVVKERLGLL